MFDPIIWQQAIQKLVGNLLDFPPRLLFALLIVGVGYILCRFLQKKVAELAARLGFSDLLERVQLAGIIKQISRGRDGSYLLGLLVFWLLFFNFLTFAADILGVKTLTDMLQSIISYLPQVLASLIIIIVGFLAAQFIRQVVQTALQRAGVDFHETLATLAYALIIAITCIIAIGQAGFQIDLLSSTFTNLITIFAAGLALAFALGGRDVIRNTLAGFYARDILQPGDEIHISEDESGTIVGIGALNTEISAPNGTILIPNSILIEQKVRVTRADSKG